MNQSNAGAAQGELGYGAWFLFWGQIVVLGLFAVCGAVFASTDAAPGDYACGMLLAVGAIAMAFLLLKRRFDGAPADWASVLLVDNMAGLVAAIAVYTGLALVGLFAAASVDDGGLHDGGLALSVISALAVFLSIKRVFDTLERRR